MKESIFCVEKGKIGMIYWDKRNEKRAGRLPGCLNGKKGRKEK